MWTRHLLKTKAKERVYANYWKAVLAAFILMLIAAVGGGNSHSTENDREEAYSYSDDAWYGQGHHLEENAEGFLKYGTDSFLQYGTDFLPGLFQYRPIVGTILGVTAVMLGMIVILLSIFIINPLEVGGKRFFTQNLRKKADIKELGCAFDRNYRNVVLTMFLRDLFTILWCFLLVIPGLVKAYEYRMIPYILAEHPEMPRNQAFTLSRDMMYGNKWNAFLLDWSFLGWEILNALTCGILGIFYVDPYRHQTDAALYQFLKEEREYQN